MAVLLSGKPADPPSGPDDGGVFPEQVAATLLRGHLELYSPVTVPQLAELTGLSTTLLQVGLLTLEGEGSAIQGRFTASTPPKSGAQVTASVTSSAQNGEGGEIEWCSRRLLARMHGRSRQTRRRAVADPVTPELFMRFLCRWQHVTPGTQVTSPAGLQRVLEQLQGWEAAVASWEPDILGARVNGYRRSWIDRLCHDGEIQWLRLSPRTVADPDRRGTGVSKATPVSIVHRHDLPWLLAAHRGEIEAQIPKTGAVAEVVEALTEYGPRFLTELAADTGRLPTDIETALWEGVARGLFTADGFEAVRSLTAPPAQQRQEARRGRQQARALSRLRRSGVKAAHSAGRWSLVPSVAPTATAPIGPERDDLIEALADQLLQRWGVLFYDLIAHENSRGGLAVPWRDLQWALRRLEDRGLIKGGRFVKGFSGEQFALPEAVESMKLVRRVAGKGNRSGPSRTVTVCGSDPLNLTGVILPDPRIPARRTETVVLPC